MRESFWKIVANHYVQCAYLLASYSMLVGIFYIFGYWRFVGVANVLSYMSFIDVVRLTVLPFFVSILFAVCCILMVFFVDFLSCIFPSASKFGQFFDQIVIYSVQVVILFYAVKILIKLPDLDMYLIIAGTFIVLFFLVLHKFVGSNFLKFAPYVSLFVLVPLMSFSLGVVGYERVYTKSEENVIIHSAKMDILKGVYVGKIGDRVFVISDDRSKVYCTDISDVYLLEFIIGK